MDLTGLPEEPSKSPPKHYTRSSTVDPNNSEKKKLEQDAEDTNTYNLSKVEVIDVDASDERDVLRRKVGKIVWEKYGEDLQIFSGTADFLLYITGELKEDTSKASVPSTVTESTTYVDHFGPFTIVPLFYMRAMAYSQLFQALTDRNLPKAATGCQFSGRTLTYKARFQLCHISKSANKRKSIKKYMGAEKTKIITFMKENFFHPLIEERDSMDLSFDRGEILYIICFTGQGDHHHIIAVIMYVSCAKGSYINWFAVSPLTYNSTRFGKYANKQPFRNMGLGSFLLQMVQLQAVAQGFSCDLYLQANKAAPAFSYYQHRGFVPTATNDPKHLPATLFTMYQKSLKEQNANNPFVYFATDAELIADAKSRRVDPEAPEVRAEFLHLLKLEGLLKLTGSSDDVKDVYLVEQCLPKCSEDTAFLQFPFSDTGLRLNSASKELLLLDHPWFKFKDGRDNALREEVEDSGGFSNVLLNFESYLMLKKDVETLTFKQWLNDQHMEFFSRWMMRNKQSPLVQATEIVDVQVSCCVKDFFEKEEQHNQRGCPMYMHNIHIYLHKHLDLLSKKFILFPMNEGDNHWNGWAAVNPWVQLARVVYERVDPKEKQNKEEYDFNFLKDYARFANGLISCDGIYEKGVEDTKCIIWFLNMASAYCDMAIDGVLGEFNHKKHTPRTYWMIGCTGPFGKIDVKAGKSFFTYKILTLHQDVRPVQTVADDWFNCGLIWCLFVYDMMLQVTKSYYNIL